MPTHHYINTKLMMSVVNPNCRNTLVLKDASGNLVTADGGKTWTQYVGDDSEVGSHRVDRYLSLVYHCGYEDYGL